MEELCKGFVHYIQEDFMIILSMDKDPHSYPLCDAMFIKVIKENEYVTTIEVN